MPTKPFVALVGFLCIVGFVAWLTLGRAVAASYYDAWWRAVRQELANANAPLWTLQRGRLPHSLPSRPNPPAHYAASDERPLPSR